MSKVQKPHTVLRIFFAVCLCALLGGICAFAVNGCPVDNTAPLSPTEMKEVMPSTINGLSKKIKADSYKGTLTASATIEPAWGRVVNLERFDSAANDWVVEQEYTTEDAQTANITVEFGNSWKQHASSKWRLNAPPLRNAGPNHEILGETQAETKIRNVFVSSKAAIVMDAETGQIVYDYNAKAERKIASMTKMMTAILLTENRKPSDPIKITKKVWETEYSFGLSKGDVLTAEQILYAMMLPSANDAASAAAYEVGDTLKKFAKMMNAKAKELGCTSSVFVTPHGLDAEGAHSTALDVARIGRYLMTSDTCALLRKVVKTKRYDFSVKTKVKKKDPVTGKKKTEKIVHAYSLENTDEMLNKKDKALGIKTGYTGGAGSCFCGAFDINGKVYVTVVMGDEVDGARWKDTRKLVKFTRYALKQGFETFEL